jgi:Zn-dependent peptidase ImmA (M78 family)
MTTDPAYDPYEHADRLGVQVVYGRLRTANGLWLPDQRTIILNTKMRVMLERTTLTHEIGHVCLGHIESTPRNERMADRFAAKHLVDPDHLERVSRFTPDPAQWAVELQITPHVLETYLTMRSA